MTHVVLESSNRFEGTPYPILKPVRKVAKKPVIVIDPGHGGRDPGAVGAKGTKEKTITTAAANDLANRCLLYTSPSPRDQRGSRMPSSA